MSAILDFPVKPETRPYLEAFTRERHKREPDWLLGYRNRNLARFAEIGFPSRRGEDWRYLDLRTLEQRPMLPAARETAVVGSSGSAPLREIGLPEPAYRLSLHKSRVLSWPSLFRCASLWGLGLA